jgi:FxsC-like protein
LGAAEAPYAENGLCALLRLSPYRPAYRKVVDRLAGQIVSLAETVPVRASAVPDIDEVVSPFLAEVVSATFTVTVAAPTLRQLPPGRNPRYYGEDSVSWRPFSQQQELSLADHVLGAAERLDFSVEIIGISKAADQVDSGPGIVLIDPWYIEDESNLNTLQSLIRNLPGWVLPVVVHDSVPDPRAARLTAQITDILNAARLKRTESVRRAIEGIDSLQGFDSLLPVLVTEAERQYLRYGPFPRRAVSPRTRPRLSGHGVFTHQPPEEEPND